MRKGDADIVLHIERDSRKDEVVVFVFIFATAGLLLWAAIKPWVSRWFEVGAIIVLRTGVVSVLTRIGRAQGKGGAIYRFLAKEIIDVWAFSGSGLAFMGSNVH